MKRVLILVAIVAVSACGSDSSSVAPTPTIAQIAGVWRGTARTASTSGGECFAATFASTVGGSGPITVAVSQSGASVGATVTSDANGGNYTYSGSVGQSAISLTGSSCSACNFIGAHCPSSTATRDIKLQTLSVSGTVSGSVMTGTQSETYNVFVAGTTTAVGTLVLSSTFTVTRQ